MIKVLDFIKSRVKTLIIFGSIIVLVRATGIFIVSQKNKTSRTQTTVATSSDSNVLSANDAINGGTDIQEVVSSEAVETQKPTPTPTQTVIATQSPTPTPKPDPEVCFTYSGNEKYSENVYYFYSEVNFDASCSKGNIKEYVWQFGKTSAQQMRQFGKTVSVRFAVQPSWTSILGKVYDPAKADVLLTITDSDGITATKSEKVNLEVPPDRQDEKWW